MIGMFSLFRVHRQDRRAQARATPRRLRGLGQEFPTTGDESGAVPPSVEPVTGVTTVAPPPTPLPKPVQPSGVTTWVTPPKPTPSTFTPPEPESQWQPPPSVVTVAPPLPPPAPMVDCGGGVKAPSIAQCPSVLCPDGKTRVSPYDYASGKCPPAQTGSTLVFAPPTVSAQTGTLYRCPGTRDTYVEDLSRCPAPAPAAPAPSAAPAAPANLYAQTIKQCPGGQSVPSNVPCPSVEPAGVTTAAPVPTIYHAPAPKPSSTKPSSPSIKQALAALDRINKIANDPLLNGSVSQQNVSMSDGSYTSVDQIENINPSNGRFSARGSNGVAPTNVRQAYINASAAGSSLLLALKSLSSLRGSGSSQGNMTQMLSKMGVEDPVSIWGIINKSESGSGGQRIVAGEQAAQIGKAVQSELWSELQGTPLYQSVSSSINTAVDWFKQKQQQIQNAYKYWRSQSQSAAASTTPKVPPASTKPAKPSFLKSVLFQYVVKGYVDKYGLTNLTSNEQALIGQAVADNYDKGNAAIAEAVAAAILKIGSMRQSQSLQQKQDVMQQNLPPLHTTPPAQVIDYIDLAKEPISPVAGPRPSYPTPPGFTYPHPTIKPTYQPPVQSSARLTAVPGIPAFITAASLKPGPSAYDISVAGKETAQDIARISSGWAQRAGAPLPVMSAPYTQLEWQPNLVEPLATSGADIADVGEQYLTAKRGLTPFPSYIGPYENIALKVIPPKELMIKGGQMVEVASKFLTPAEKANAMGWVLDASGSVVSASPGWSIQTANAVLKQPLTATQLSDLYMAAIRGDQALITNTLAPYAAAWQRAVQVPTGTSAAQSFLTTASKAGQYLQKVPGVSKGVSIASAAGRKAMALARFLATPGVTGTLNVIGGMVDLARITNASYQANKAMAEAASSQFIDAETIESALDQLPKDARDALADNRRLRQLVNGYSVLVDQTQEVQSTAWDKYSNVGRYVGSPGLPFRATDAQVKAFRAKALQEYKDAGALVQKAQQKLQALTQLQQAKLQAGLP
jgi:hypothetical protein